MRQNAAAGDLNLDPGVLTEIEELLV
jgi:hypothetical protein